MIAKGTPHRNGPTLAKYLVTGKDGERAALWQLRGFALESIVDAFRTVHVMAEATRCEAPFFHVAVRNLATDRLDASQWTYTADAIEQALGLVDQPRAIAFHICGQTGESHMHVAWSRIDEDRLTAKPLPFFKERLKRVCRELERRFGLTEISSARKGTIVYAPTRREEEQARRLGIDLRDHRETIRDCFERSDCGRSFQKALAAKEIILARGNRRDFIAIDRAGGMHALGKRILGLAAAEIRARLSDLSREPVPTVEEARQILSSPKAPKIRLDAKSFAPRPPNPSVEDEEAQLVNTIMEGPAPSIEDALCRFVDSPPPDEAIERPIPRPVEDSASAANADKNRENSAGLAAVIKRQFRAAVGALFKRTQSPQPQARRRRSGETLGTFRFAARSTLRPIVRLPAVSCAIGFLNEVLPWLHLWEWSEIGDHDSFEEIPSAHDNHHSPHP